MTDLIERLQVAVNSANANRLPAIAHLLTEAAAALEAARVDAERLAEALRWAERHCPCGARPESPTTHPHIPGCPVGAALHPTAAQEEGNGQ